VRFAARAPKRRKMLQGPTPRAWAGALGSQEHIIGHSRLSCPVACPKECFSSPPGAMVQGPRSWSFCGDGAPESHSTSSRAAGKEPILRQKVPRQAEVGRGHTDFAQRSAPSVPVTRARLESPPSRGATRTNNQSCTEERLKPSKMLPPVPGEASGSGGAPGASMVQGTPPTRCSSIARSAPNPRKLDAGTRAVPFLASSSPWTRTSREGMEDPEPGRGSPGAPPTGFEPALPP